MENYKETEATITRISRKIAKILREKMEELSLNTVKDYKIITHKTASGHKHTALYVTKTKEEPKSLEDEKESVFYGTCLIEAASIEERIEFLYCAKELLEKIDGIKEKRIAEAEKVLKETENFIKQLN